MSRLFHKDKDTSDHPHHNGINRSSATSLGLLSLKALDNELISLVATDTSSSIVAPRRNDDNDPTNNGAAGAPPGRHRPRRAETIGHIGAPKPGLPPVIPPPNSRASNHGPSGKIKYNPYGVNKLLLNQVQRLTLFYMKGGPGNGLRVVANPVANPNDFLPEDLQENHINFLEDFEFDQDREKTIGTGGLGDVRIVSLIGNKRQVYALKKFSLFNKETDDEFYKRAAKEYVLLKRVSSSRHVARSVALVRLQSQGQMARGWGMVMEFCGGGDLFNLIVKPGWKRTLLAERFCIFKQIAYGVKFLHDNDIVHRDLKPENILLNSDGLAKLCDFGVSDYGHVEPLNFDSDIHLMHTYVGSPPYLPPEVMQLKDMLANECKKHPYDPFKMDHWALGMLLFCIVYLGVPFQLSLTNDHHYRDYSFNRNRFCQDNPLFKNNNDFSKGPGSEFKWAAQFQLNGAARVAWKLCDPSVKSRYDLDTLFKDTWFSSLEMCVYEHPDQTVDPFVHLPTSSTPSRTNSQAPSRRNTIQSPQNDRSDEGLHTPKRSMLDMAGINPNICAHNEVPDNSDLHSVHLNSLLLQVALKLDKEAARRRPSGSDASVHLNTSSALVSRTRSMLDVAQAADKQTLPRVDEVGSEKQAHGKIDELEEEIEAEKDHADNDDNDAAEAEEPKSEQKEDPVPPVDDAAPLHPPQDLKFDSKGCCELGYKIRKHHHLDVSAVAIAGSKSRRS